MITVRIYGILINEQQQILVSDEYIRGMYITKFCGGGLEVGEGTRDCLRREFMEEMNLKIEVLDHFYTTDYYQPSAFRKGDQILSIYYKVKALEPITAPLRSEPFQFDTREMKQYEASGETETFRFVHLDAYSPDCMTLPIDKLVATMIMETYNANSEPAFIRLL